MSKKNLLLILLMVMSVTIYSQQTAMEIEPNGTVSVKTKLTDNNGATYDALPIGTILMFNGTGWQDNITLKGWVECALESNGNTKVVNNIEVPNLENMFIMGTTSAALEAPTPVRTGGSNSVNLTVEQLPAHSHDLTIVSDGAHEHTSRDYYYPVTYYGRGPGEGPALQHKNLTYANRTSSTAGAHSHSGSSIANTGSGAAIDNRPNYYTVIYIMKVSY